MKLELTVSCTVALEIGTLANDLLTTLAREGTEAQFEVAERQPDGGCYDGEYLRSWYTTDIVYDLGTPLEDRMELFVTPYQRVAEDAARLLDDHVRKSYPTLPLRPFVTGQPDEGEEDASILRVTAVTPHI